MPASFAVTTTSSRATTSTPLGPSRGGRPHQHPAQRAGSSTFLVTKEHRRFAEFADACRRERYIGVCYGAPGVGKTLSARHYASWDQLEPWLARHRLGGDQDHAPAILAEARTVLYTPPVTVTPRQLDHDVDALCRSLNYAIDDYLNRDPDKPFHVRERPHAQLLIVDEADRLKTSALEQLRDCYDRHRIGLILIGMPGIEKRLARYPQLYSRIGFAHQYRPLSADELRFVLTHHWQALGLDLAAGDFTDTEAIATVARITNGNFRLVNRLFAQIKRILEINNLTTITREVIETARESLVIGQP